MEIGQPYFFAWKRGISLRKYSAPVLISVSQFLGTSKRKIATSNSAESSTTWNVVCGFLQAWYTVLRKKGPPQLTARGLLQGSRRSMHSADAAINYHQLSTGRNDHSPRDDVEMCHLSFTLPEDSFDRFQDECLAPFLTSRMTQLTFGFVDVCAHLQTSPPSCLKQWEGETIT